MVEKQDINIPLVTTVSVASVILLFVIVVGVQAWFRWEFRRGEAAKAADSVNLNLQTMRSEQLDQLNEYRWVNQDEGVVRIPIDRAMQLTARRLGQNPVAQATD